jgi:(p)ppGpp synthase/HD superfamily hydrolase
MDNIVERARTVAIAAHSATGQRRKYTGEPYWVHLQEVADTVAYVSQDTAMVAAAWLHDILEDTQLELDLLLRLFGEDVTDMVVWLTDTAKISDGNRATRAGIERMRLASASARVQTIKIADIMSNVRSIAEHDKKFARIYLPEKSLLLDELLLGDPILRVNARAMVDKQLMELSGR